MRAHSLAALIACALSLVSSASGFLPTGIDCMGTICADGYICSPETYLCEKPKKSYSETLRKRQSTNFIPVTGPVNTGIRERQNILAFQNNADAFNMFLWALAVMQVIVPETHPLSYYQISGIHGRPFIPWMEPTTSSQNPTTGYCTHSSALFATWHRPFISLMEQRIVATARTEANNYPAGPIRDRWMNAAMAVRLPYWDWSASDLRSAIPQIVMTPRVTVVRPLNGVATTQTIANPLYQYAFRDQSLKNRWFEGFYNSAAATRRNPTNDGRASQNSISNQAMLNSYASRRQSTFNLFTQPTFRQFSNTQFSAGGDPGSFNSVESIHNQVHVNIGGTGNSNGDLGHMSVVDYSSFDPIFWLHHCNIDRLVAMYQAIWPNRGLESQPAASTFSRRARQGDMDTVNTPLTPFRKPNGQYFTSVDVMPASSVWELGYAYPEIPVSYRGRPASDLSTFVSGRVRDLYGPSAPAGSRKRDLRSSGYITYEWNVHIVFNPMETIATTECMIFVGNYTRNGQDSKTQPTYVGSGVAFKKAPVSDVPPQHGAPPATEDKYITSSVPLTQKIRESGIDPNKIKDVVAHLKDFLHWSVTVGTEEISTEKLPSLLIGVSAAKVTYGPGNPLPEVGTYETYYECTAGKVGGLTVLHHDLVKSVDIPSVLGGPVIIEPPTPVVGYTLDSEKKTELQDQKQDIAKSAGVTPLMISNDNGAAVILSGNFSNTSAEDTKDKNNKDKNDQEKKNDKKETKTD